MDDRRSRSDHREGWAIGPTEIIIVLVIVVLLFGAKRIPELARNLGSGAREFKDGITGKDEPEHDGVEPPRPPKDDDPL